MSTDLTLTEASDGVFLIEGPDVNWTILRDGHQFTLVDTGYPGYVSLVEESLRRCGLDIAGLVAVVLTHAHIDHIGGAPALLRDGAVPVYAGEHEVPMALGVRHESAGPADVLKQLWKPRFIPWSARITRAGGAKRAVVSAALGAADGATLDIPGQPRVIHTPGHTSGSICLSVRDVLITGDALITGHAVSSTVGPQMAADFFHTDKHRALTALDRLTAVNASAILPGHGPMWRGSIREAVASARG